MKKPFNRLDIFARGGPEVTTRSRFMKSADVFRTGIERNDYNKSGKGGGMSKRAGDKPGEAAPAIPVKAQPVFPRSSRRQP